jgi:hypothetical protein
MVSRFRLLLIFLGVLLIAGALLAADPKPLTSESTATNIPDNLKDYYYTGLAPEKLSYAIDLWYDAVLKGDDRRTDRFEYVMLEMVHQDLDSTRLALAQFSQYYERTKAEAVLLDSTAPHGAYLPVLEKLDQDVYSEVWQIYRTKEKLYEAIQHSPFPSNKYRLITDYIDVLRRQIGLPKLKIVYNANGHSSSPQGQQGSPQEN